MTTKVYPVADLVITINNQLQRMASSGWRHGGGMGGAAWAAAWVAWAWAVAWAWVAWEAA